MTDKIIIYSSEKLNIQYQYEQCYLQYSDLMLEVKTLWKLKAVLKNELNEFFFTSPKDKKLSSFPKNAKIVK